MASDDIDMDDIMLFASVAVLGIIAVNFVRQQAATDQRGPVFSPTGPSLPIVNDAINILVPMTVSESGAAFIRAAEGLSLSRRADGNKQQIGYGHDIQAGENVPARITQSQAEALLQADLETVADQLNKDITIAVTQNQFDALASLVYNIGAGAFAGSTLLRKLNAGDYAGASQEFLSWDNSGGGYNQVLANRRQGEQGIFNT